MDLGHLSVPCLLYLGVFVLVSMVGIEPRASHVLDKCSIIKLLPELSMYLLLSLNS